jgi:hypothetical protein
VITSGNFPRSEVRVDWPAANAGMSLPIRAAAEVLLAPLTANVRNAIRVKVKVKVSLGVLRVAVEKTLPIALVDGRRVSPVPNRPTRVAAPVAVAALV